MHFLLLWKGDVKKQYCYHSGYFTIHLWSAGTRHHMTVNCLISSKVLLGLCCCCCAKLSHRAVTFRQPLCLMNSPSIWCGLMTHVALNVCSNNCAAMVLLGSQIQRKAFSRKTRSWINEVCCLMVLAIKCKTKSIRNNCKMCFSG